MGTMGVSPGGRAAPLGIYSALAEQQAELTGLLEGLDDEGWHRPTRCEGWDVADVVLHLVQTNVMAQGSNDGRFDEVLAGLLEGAAPAGNVDEGAAVMVDLERGLPNADLLRRWRDEAAHLVASLRAGDPDEKVTWVAGQLRRRTLATTRLAETWIHTGDVADAVGVALPDTERLEHIARLAWRTLPYAFQKAERTLSGPVAFELVGPSGRPWTFVPEEPAVTVVRGPGAELCAVAGRRVAPGATALEAEGPDAEAVLELVRTYA